MKRTAAVPQAVIMLFLGVLTAESQTNEEYRQRRDMVRKTIEEKAIMVLRSSQSVDTFKLDKNFYYLTGLAEPNTLLVLTKEEEILFLPPRDPERELWEHKKLYPGTEAETATGIRKTQSADDFKDMLDSLYPGKTHLYTETRVPSGFGIPMIIEKFMKRDTRTDNTLRHPDFVIAPMRLVKSRSETNHLIRAVDVTVRSMKNAMQSLTAGKTEREIIATVDFAFRLHGAAPKSDFQKIDRLFRWRRKVPSTDFVGGIQDLSAR